jgi:regulation of enolase protein 1 (concanavalin A-like superfamily)
MLAKFIPVAMLFFGLLAACNQTREKPEIATATSSRVSLGTVARFDTSLNNADKQSIRDSATLTMSATKETDYFIEPGGAYEKADAPLALKKIDNKKPFTFTAELKPEHNVKYDAGMLFILVDEKHWVKFAFEQDEHGNNRIVTVRTNSSSDDNNHDVVNDSLVFMKISSDTKSVGFYYSTNGSVWTLVRVFKNEFPQNILVGIGTQSPAGAGNKTIFYGAAFSDSAIRDFRTGM